MIRSWEARFGESEGPDVNHVKNLGYPHRWLDETPTGRIIARCTQDIRAIDGPVPEVVKGLAELGITLLTKLVVIIIFTPIFMFPSMLVAIFGFSLGNLYLRAQLSVKREMRYVIAVLPLHTVLICYSAMHVPHYWLTLVQQLRV